MTTQTFLNHPTTELPKVRDIHASGPRIGYVKSQGHAEPNEGRRTPAVEHTPEVVRLQGVEALTVARRALRGVVDTHIEKRRQLPPKRGLKDKILGREAAPLSTEDLRRTVLVENPRLANLVGDVAAHGDEAFRNPYTAAEYTGHDARLLLEALHQATGEEVEPNPDFRKAAEYMLRAVQIQAAEPPEPSYQPRHAGVPSRVPDAWMEQAPVPRHDDLVGTGHR